MDQRHRYVMETGNAERWRSHYNTSR